MDTAAVSRQLELELNAIYDALCATGAETSARRITEACLFLRQHKAKKITASAVGEFCREKFGGPLTQSIRNKQSTLLRLVQLHGELHDMQTKGTGTGKRTPKTSLAINDPGLAAYVMVLETRIKELLRSNERLSQAFRKLEPLQIGSVLAAPQRSVEEAAAPSPMKATDVEREAIERFLRAEHLDRFGLQLDDRQRIMDGSHVLVESPIVRLLSRILDR